MHEDQQQVRFVGEERGAAEHYQEFNHAKDPEQDHACVYVSLSVLVLIAFILKAVADTLKNVDSLRRGLVLGDLTFVSQITEIAINWRTSAMNLAYDMTPALSFIFLNYFQI